MKRMVLLLVFVFTSSIFGSGFGLKSSYGIRVNDSLPSIKQVSNITVGVKKFDDINGRWKYIVKQAILYLNVASYDAGSAVHFKWVGTTGISSPADVSLSYDDSLKSSVFARTAYGSKKYGIGSFIHINRYTKKHLRNMEKIGAMKHELLHTIGFVHSYTRNNAYPSVKVPNTDGYYDWKYAGPSIMLENYVGQTHLNFLDKRALGLVFPK